MSAATVLLQPDFPAGFLILFGITVAIATILLFGVLAEIERERRQQTGSSRRDPS